MRCCAKGTGLGLRVQASGVWRTISARTVSVAVRTASGARARTRSVHQASFFGGDIETWRRLLAHA